MTVDALSKDRLVALLGMYANVYDCPICHAPSKVVGATVTPMRGENYMVEGGHWRVVHGLSCDVGRAMALARVDGKDGNG